MKAYSTIPVTFYFWALYDFAITFALNLHFIRSEWILYRDFSDQFYLLFNSVRFQSTEESSLNQ